MKFSNAADLKKDDIDIRIRIATRDDVESIVKFNVLFAKKTNNKNLSLPITEAGVHHVFSSFNSGFYVVAHVDEKIVGMTMITKEWSDWSNGFFYCIQSIYVICEIHNKVIHDGLFDKAIALAKAHHDVCGIRIYVHKDDVNLQKQYLNLGLHDTEYRLFEQEFK